MQKRLNYNIGALLLVLVPLQYLIANLYIARVPFDSPVSLGFKKYLISSTYGFIVFSDAILYLIMVFSMSGIGRNPIPGLGGRTEYPPVKTGMNNE